VRGEDLRASTELQLDIARRLGLSAFLDITFEHHPLVLDADGSKLSKSTFPAKKR
jgi:glutamyl-tRNA synthetase